MFSLNISLNKHIQRMWIMASFKGWSWTNCYDEAKRPDWARWGDAGVFRRYNWLWTTKWTYQSFVSESRNPKWTQRREGNSSIDFCASERYLWINIWLSYNIMNMFIVLNWNFCFMLWTFKILLIAFLNSECMKCNSVFTFFIFVAEQS